MSADSLLEDLYSHVFYLVNNITQIALLLARGDMTPIPVKLNFINCVFKFLHSHNGVQFFTIHWI